MKRLLFILLWLVGAWQTAPGEIITADRRATWQGNVGVVGGIPARTTIFTNMALLDTTGATNCSAEINAALSACPSNQVVLLPAGRIKVGAQIRIHSHMTLRGAGLGSTVLVVDYGSGDWGNIIFGYDATPDTVQNITGSYAPGATTVQVSDSTQYSVGAVVILDALNDTNVVSNVGYPGDNVCSDCDRASGARVRWQLGYVSSKPNSTNITFHPPLLFPLAATNTPQVANVLYWVQNSGLEDLSITNKSGQAVTTIGMDQTYRCWVKNVESDRCHRKHVWLMRALQCEVRDSYFHGAVDFTSNSGYGLEADGSTACLIENNIFYELTLPLVTAKGGGGHVVAYNYFERFRKDGVDGLSASIFANHGPHVTMCLFEGNKMQKFNSDFDFGSTDYMTLFRNQITAYTTNYPYNKKAVDIRKFNLNFNLVGNVLGNLSQTTNGAIYEIEDDATSWAQEGIYKLGYLSDGDDGAAGNDSRVKTTLLRHGDWDFVTSGTTWDGGIADHTLPDSLYLAVKPSWYATWTWPPMDGSAGTVNTLPAEARYLSLEAPASPPSGGASNYVANAIIGPP